RLFHVCDGCREPNADSLADLNGRRIRGACQHLPQAADCLVDAVLADSDAVPGSLRQVVLRHEPAAGAAQDEEDIELPVGQRQRLTVLEQTAAPGIELERAKAVDRTGRSP